MPMTAAGRVRFTYVRVQDIILKFLDKATDEQLHWQSTSGHSIAWHAWHLGRWADHLQVALRGMSPELRAMLGKGTQVWHNEGLAARWGFNPAELGYDETGLEMSDDVTKAMRFPAKAELLDYVHKAFTGVQQVVGAIDDEQFASLMQFPNQTEALPDEAIIGGAVIDFMIHDFRHLGMMEALLGMQGEKGTATA